MAFFTPEFIVFACFWVAGVLIFLLIMWAIIRGAVLSALRKHADEQAPVKSP